MSKDADYVKAHRLRARLRAGHALDATQSEWLANYAATTKQYNRPLNPDAKVVDGKDPLGWIPLTALAGVARQMAAGGSKYPRGNFAEALYDDDTADRYVSAALRHLTKAQAAGGVWSMARLASQRDPDTQELELDAVIANLLMLREVVARSGEGEP